jgi:hypothetical protein
MRRRSQWIWPPTKAFTAEQVGLVRAWIDQGAKQINLKGNLYEKL